MAGRRHSRRITRKIEDLPSLFDDNNAAVQSEFVRSEAENKRVEESNIDEFIVPDEFSHRPAEFKYMSFGSGSSGNCAYIGTGDCGILIDAGVDNNYVTKELLRNGIDISSVRGIFLTHDHGDHVRFAYSILRRNHHMRLYCTPRTLEGLLRRHNISRRIKDYHSPIYKEHDYVFDDMRITPFETSHDGTDNCGFSIKLQNKTFVVATDMGVVTERADYYIRQANALMIESDYDEQMLSEGRYTEYLKARIRSATGHMDNAMTSRYLTEIYTPKLKQIFLCHLSEDNNTPETAIATALNALRTISIFPARSVAEIHPGTVYITALPRYKTSDLYII